jgi:hypothetical protein
VAALAGVAALSSGTATVVAAAVAAEADKNVRRVAPVRPEALFLSMPPNQCLPSPLVNAVRFVQRKSLGLPRSRQTQTEANGVTGGH